jgi:crossover junction endodeoxyribonuclease RuvC
MLQRLIAFDEDPKYFDATDALAVAVCHHFQGNSLLKNKTPKVNGWKEFLMQNPGRIK